MNKLFKLKKYFSIAETKDYLCNTLGENVSIADIYRLALDGELIMSVKFNGLFEMSPGRILNDLADKITPEIFVSKGIAVGEDLRQPYYVKKKDCFPITLREWLFFDNEIMYANGIWDLSMYGRELVDVERLHQKESGGIGDFTSEINGVILKRNDSFCILKILKSDSYNGMKILSGAINVVPDEDYADCLSLNDYSHQLIIKQQELTRFVQSLQEELPTALQGEKELLSKERNTLLTFIGSLLNELDINPSDRGVSSAIKLIAEKSGMAISENTIRKILRQVVNIKD